MPYIVISALLVISIIANVVLAICLCVTKESLSNLDERYDELYETYNERLRRYNAFRNKVIAVLDDETK